MSESKEVAETKPTAVAQVGDVFGAEDIDNSDLIIPRITLMQDRSNWVKDGTAQSGEMVNSLTKATFTESIEIVPIFSAKFWREQKNPGTKQEESRKFSWDSSNMGLIWDETDESGATIKRRPEIDWFCVLPHDLAEGAALPVIVTFRGVSMQAGKSLNTFIKQGAMLGKPACGFAYELKVGVAKTDNGDFHKYEIGNKRPSTGDEFEAAKLWYTTLKGQTKIKTDEETPF